MEIAVALRGGRGLEIAVALRGTAGWIFVLRLRTGNCSTASPGLYDFLPSPTSL